MAAGIVIKLTPVVADGARTGLKIELRNRQRRARIDAQRSRFGRDAYLSTNPSLSARLIQAVHVNEMRTALNAACSAMAWQCRQLDGPADQCWITLADDVSPREVRPSMFDGRPGSRR